MNHPILPAILGWTLVAGLPAAAEPPYPRSDRITGCAIDPVVHSFPRTVAKPGDNWPLTWAGDGRIYTFLADGHGFTPFKAMVSMHPCVLDGHPADGSLRGRDIPCNATGTGLGYDVQGRKVSGLIAIPDPAGGATSLLVAWVRNMTRAGGSAPIHSRDGGATWTWTWGGPDTPAGAPDPNLGHPAWMQAGRDHTAAPDSFLYFHSHAGPTAYLLSDHLVLGRVRREAVLDRSAYEFFCGSEGQPAWSRDSRDLRPMFTAPGQCYRPYVTWHAGARRHLLVTANGGGILKGHPGTHHLGIYESATPWGPWRTVHWEERFQPAWGVFAAQIAPAWMEDDGRTCWLAYSCWPTGPYKLNLQRVSLTFAAPPRP